VPDTATTFFPFVQLIENDFAVLDVDALAAGFFAGTVFAFDVVGLTTFLDVALGFADTFEAGLEDVFGEAFGDGETK
jgi:hypothetical protein